MRGGGWVSFPSSLGFPRSSPSWTPMPSCPSPSLLPLPSPFLGLTPHLLPPSFLPFSRPLLLLPLLFASAVSGCFVPPCLPPLPSFSVCLSHLPSLPVFSHHSLSLSLASRQFRVFPVSTLSCAHPSFPFLCVCLYPMFSLSPHFLLISLPLPLHPADLTEAACRSCSVWVVQTRK